MQIPNQVRIPHSNEAADLIRKLLTKDPRDRIGSNGGCDEILAHPWFKDAGAEHFIDLEKVKSRMEPAMLNDDFFSATNNMCYFNM